LDRNANLSEFMINFHWKTIIGRYFLIVFSGNYIDLYHQIIQILLYPIIPSAVRL
jgi:hypothetical protein